MLGRLPQVEHGLYAVGLEFRKGLEARLSPRAELRSHLQEFRDRRHLGLGGDLKQGEE